MINRACENCRYHNEGECRRYPPKVLIDPHCDHTGNVFYPYPRVLKDEWCGEFSPNIEVKVENGIIYAGCPPVQGTIVSVQEL